MKQKIGQILRFYFVISFVFKKALLWLAIDVSNSTLHKKFFVGIYNISGALDLIFFVKDARLI